MTLARVAMLDLLGMLWAALCGVSSVLGVCPSPNDDETWSAWWSRKSVVGKAWAVFMWAVALTIAAFVAHKALDNTVWYFWSR